MYYDVPKLIRKICSTLNFLGICILSRRKVLVPIGIDAKRFLTRHCIKKLIHSGGDKILRGVTSWEWWTVDEKSLAFKREVVVLILLFSL